MGAQMIEFDVQLTKDGALVLMHDPTVDRTTDGKGKISDLTFDELRKLDAGSRKGGSFKGVQIPTFEETLAMMPRDIWLNCHLKGGTALGAAAAKAVQQAGRLHQAFLAATADAAKSARAAVPEILICNMERKQDTATYARETIAMKAAFIQLLGKGDVPVEEVRQLREAGVRVNYYHDETAEGLRRQWNGGVNFPLVNHPEKALQIAREFGIEPLRHER